MRPPSRARARAAVTSFASVVLALSLAACSADDPEPAAGDVAESPGTNAATEPTETTTGPTGPTEPTEPTESTSPTGPTSTLSAETATATTTPAEQPTATASSPAAPVLAERLLPAGGMGKLNAEWTWVAGNQFDTEPQELAVCHRIGLSEIGADEVAVREYTSELDAKVRAFHLVADLVDDVNARRTYEVLRSWRDSCRQRLEERSPGRDGVRVTDPERVSSPADAASSYVVLQPTATGGTRIENVGISRDGRLIDVVVVRLEGDDFNYPRGRTPAAVAVRNAARQGQQGP